MQSRLNTQAIDVFYQDGTISRLEMERKEVLPRLFFRILLALAGSAVCVYCYNRFMPNQNINRTLNFFIYVALGLVGPIASFFIYYFTTSDYREHYKGQVIKEVLDQVSKDIRYKAEGGLTGALLEQSKLFMNYDHDSCDAEDLIYYAQGQDVIAFSEFEAVVKSGKNHSVFGQGVLGMILVGRNYTSQVLVKPRKGPFRVNNSFVKFIRNRTELETFETGEPDFDTLYTVYAEKEAPVKEVVDDALIQGILEISRTTGYNLHLSFFDEVLYVVVPSRRGFFDPPIFRALSQKFVDNDLIVLKIMFSLKKVLGLKLDITDASLGKIPVADLEEV